MADLRGPQREATLPGLRRPRYQNMTDLPPTEPVEFDQRQAAGSFERARDDLAVLRHHGRFAWRIQITDGGEHMAVLYRDNGRLMAGCDCQAWEWRDKPCAHLWAIYLANEMGIETIHDVEDGLGAAGQCPTCGTTHPEGSA